MIGDDIFSELHIKGCIYAKFSSMGPKSLFMYPLPKDIGERYSAKYKISDIITERDYMHIAIKSISLFISDYNLSNVHDDSLEHFQIFGVLPYPDISTVGFTLFSYYYDFDQDQWLPVSFTLLVEEQHRNIIYNSLNRIKSLMIPFHRLIRNLIQKNPINSMQDGEKYWDELIPKILKFFREIQNIQSLPISPITSNRRIKILFTGLENTGKTSFLLTIKREFSSLPSLLPSTEAIKNKLDFLGTTIIKWDIPGQESLRNQVLKESETYLVDADVIYFCISIQNPRIHESKTYLQKILEILKQQQLNIPIIFIITKVDEDIANSPSIKENILSIQENLSELMADVSYRFFTTSIFDLYSILNAFSYGIRQLSPNREMLNHVLHDFIRDQHLQTGLLLNENGIVLTATELEQQLENKINPNLKMSQIFEVAAPQFTSLAAKFQSFNSIPYVGMIKYEFSPQDFVLLKSFTINNFHLFVLFYSQEKDKESVIQSIESHFPQFQKKIEGLLQHYLD